MKKLLKIFALIAAMAFSCTFFGCSNGITSDGNNSNSGGSTTISFDDCTVDANKVTLSNGKWTLKVEANVALMPVGADIKATVTNESYTFTSGSETMTFDLSKKMTDEQLTEFNALDEDEKKQAVIKEFECPEDATIIFDGNNVTIKASLSEKDLEEYKSEFDLSKLPDNAKIKTNTDKTKYTIEYSNKEDTIKLYISKVSSDSNNSNSGGSTIISFDDCTVEANEVTLSDGSWTLKITLSDDKLYSESDIKATVTNESYTFTSCSATMTSDLSKMMKSDELTAFNEKSEAEKKQAVIEKFKCPKDATITFDGNNVTIKASLSEQELKEFQSYFDLSNLPGEAIIKTNSEKTKYTIEYSDKTTIIKLYINKD